MKDALPKMDSYAVQDALQLFLHTSVFQQYTDSTGKHHLTYNIPFFVCLGHAVHHTLCSSNTKLITCSSTQAAPQTITKTFPVVLRCCYPYSLYLS